LWAAAPIILAAAAIGLWTKGTWVLDGAEKAHNHGPQVAANTQARAEQAVINERLIQVTADLKDEVVRLRRILDKGPIARRPGGTR
jgi:hypothetical protein